LNQLKTFLHSEKALLLEFSSLLSMPNAREMFQGKTGTTLAAKGATLAHNGSAYLGYQTPSFYTELPNPTDAPKPPS